MTVEAVQVLLILLPGFVTSWIVLALTVRPSQTDFDKVVEALFYSFTIYTLLLFAHLINPLPIILLAEATGHGAASTMAVDVAALRTFVAWGFVLAVVFGLIVSFLSTHDILTSFFRLVQVSRRTSRITVWSDAFNDINGWVVIAFSDGRRVRGWPRYFSDTADEASVYLERAQWLGANGEPIAAEEEGLLVTRNAGIQTISFIEPQETARRWLWLVALAAVLVIALAALFFARAYVSRPAGSAGALAPANR